MTTIHEAYINALLADAAYALTINRPNGYSSDELKNLLELNNRMTPTLATYIGNNFTVVTHIDSDDITGSGFDATVWRRNDGKVYVSMTGTEGTQDFLTDADLAVSSGAARAQIVDMVNWWLKISTPATAMAAQITLVPIFDNSVPPQITTYDFQSAASVQGLGLLNGVTSIELNGHSLGGHLASAFARLFGASANSTGSGKITIDNITTFNSAGFNGSSHFVFEEIESLIGVGLGRLPNSTEQTNYFAENGLNVTTNSFFSSQVGQRLEISNEESTGIPNHFMYKLTDALALGDAIAKLDNSFDFKKMNALFDQGANQTSASLEGILDSLRKTLLGGTVTSTPTGDEGDSPSSRTSYYTNLKLLTDSTAFQSLIGKVQLVAPATSASEARADFGAFLSLFNLSPFALKTTTTDAATALQNANTVLSAQWTADNNLTSEQRTNGGANYSDMYLNDRAAMLSWVIKLNKEDFVATNNLGYSSGTQGQHFEDSATNTSIVINGLNTNLRNFKFGSDLGPLNTDTLTGGDNSDHLYGLSGADTLTGGNGNDWLEGGADADTLDGGSGADTLYGGTGSDTYLHITGDGNDVILDTDGIGIIKQGTATLNGGKLKATNLWESADKLTLYTIFTNPDGSQTLNILLTNNEKLYVKNWQSNQLGINLQAADPVTPITPVAITSGHDYLQVALNSARDGQGGNDVLVGTTGKEILNGGIGNDILFGNEGDDTLNGGDGNDFLDGGVDADELIGGYGEDVIYGGTGWRIAA